MYSLWGVDLKLIIACCWRVT